MSFQKKNRLKILISSSIFPNNQELTKGIYILNQAVALSEYCHIKVVAPVPYFPSWLKSSSYNLYSKIQKQENVNGINVFHPRVLVIPKFGRSLYGILYAISLYNIMRKMKKTFNPDIILCYWIYPDGFANVLLAKILNLPVITGGRGCDINDAASSQSKQSMVSWTLKKSNKVFSVSEAMKSEMIKLGCKSDMIKVIPNGLDSAFKPLDKAEAQIRTGLNINEHKGKIILYCGRLSHEKGLEHLLKAASHLKKKGSNFLLLLAGDGPQRKWLSNLSEELNLNGEVKFIGEVEYSKIPALMNLADIFCLPSIREGWPNVVVEALGCGVPVVASNVGGIPEIISDPDYGTLVPPENDEALGDALYNALQKEWNRESVIDSVRNRTWDSVAQEVYNEVREVINNR